MSIPRFTAELDGAEVVAVRASDYDEIERQRDQVCADYLEAQSDLTEARMLLRQCVLVWKNHGPLSALITAALDRTADRETAKP